MGATTTVCLACGSETTVSREFPEPQLGGASVDEIETLLRSEWRGSLGPTAYERKHDARLVRALIAYGLDPQSPVRDLIAERRIHLELLMLGSHGLDREAVSREFAALSRATREVLGRSLQPERAVELADRFDRKLQATLGWQV